ncbi:ArsR/SmtB family transcription factor [Actinocrispum wychmicini]|uniref:ArsR/SmtB family transcription factor n=1 Tax=Actinocrispum wychmicini TaxID=1213861 RepID=UPI001FB72DEC|nr:metalloregulator ArsR/SmtB family transcription factor [Actinocrispum wychmicini]
MQDTADDGLTSAYDKIFAALAHPTRRQILVTVYFEGGAMGAGDIARMFEHAWPTISRHLQVLDEAGLVTTEKHGRTRTYRLNRERIDLVTDWLTWFGRDEKESHD